MLVTQSPFRSGRFIFIWRSFSQCMMQLRTSPCRRNNPRSPPFPAATRPQRTAARLFADVFPAAFRRSVSPAYRFRFDRACPPGLARGRAGFPPVHEYPAREKTAARRARWAASGRDAAPSGGDAAGWRTTTSKAGTFLPETRCRLFQRLPPASPVNRDPPPRSNPARQLPPPARRQLGLQRFNQSTKSPRRLGAGAGQKLWQVGVLGVVVGDDHLCINPRLGVKGSKYLLKHLIHLPARRKTSSLTATDSESHRLVDSRCLPDELHNPRCFASITKPISPEMLMPSRTATWRPNFSSINRSACVSFASTMASASPRSSSVSAVRPGADLHLPDLQEIPEY